MFTTLRRRYIASKYRRKGLRIIQSIQAPMIEKIFAAYEKSGWEMTDAYGGFNAQKDKWKCKLRKGTSVLTFNWEKDRGGSISGVARIVNGLGKEFELPVLDTPDW